MNKVEVCFSPNLYPVYKRTDNIVVIIDVLRATSAICTAFYYGAEKIIPVATVEEALKYKQQGFLVGAERDAIKVDGFDFGNSPFDYMTDKIKGKSIVLTTTNGTQAIEAAKNAHKVVIGAFLNFTVLCDWLKKENKSVLLLCSGWKNRFNLEDTLFAGAVAEELSKHVNFPFLDDAALAAKFMYQTAKTNPHKYLRNSSHRKRLAALNLKKDIKYCLAFDKTNLLPILEKDCLVVR
ncbi:MAG TPA: 2-phosphosulfolactate phosphatase [Bacteroidia bacterium]|nr:2-phosphosulfolactate phosphatase [Bacteroidia bacterium]